MVLVMIGAYRHPGSETPLTWQAFILAGLLDLPALGSHAPRLLYAYPAFFVVMGAGVLIAAALGARAVPVPAALVQRARIQQAMAEQVRGHPVRGQRGQRRLLRAPEPAPPAPRPACPAGQWAICGGSPHVPDGEGSRLLERGPGPSGRGHSGRGHGGRGHGGRGHRGRGQSGLGQGGRSPDETGDRLLGSQPS